MDHMDNLLSGAGLSVERDLRFFKGISRVDIPTLEAQFENYVFVPSIGTDGVIYNRAVAKLLPGNPVTADQVRTYISRKAEEVGSNLCNPSWDSPRNKSQFQPLGTLEGVQWIGTCFTLVTSDH